MVPKKRTGFLYGIIGECNVVVFFSFNLLVQLENYIYHLETVIRNGSINNVLLIITAAILSLNKKIYFRRPSDLIHFDYNMLLYTHAYNHCLGQTRGFVSI